MKKHFVTFYSPGTFVTEQTTKPIDSWDTDKAVEMSKDIVERYGATPYCFRFSTKEREEKDFDSKVTKESSNYFLGGEVFTVEQLKALKNKEHKILISNMEGNGWKRTIINTNSYRWTQPFNDDDVLLKV